MAGKPVDWERIEAQYRAGTMTLREISGQHGVSHVLVLRRAKAGGWTRDLTAKIKARADDLITKALVTKRVTKSSKALAAAVTVEIEGQVQARIRLGQRADVMRARSLCSRLLMEVDEMVGAADPIEAIKALRVLSDTLGTLITLERGVYGIPAIEPSPPAKPRPPAGVLGTPQETYRWLIGQQGAILDVEDAVERVSTH